MYPLFKTAVGTILTNWNPLQFAVHQQAGGKESAAIADWMVGIIEQYFHENEDLEPEEVADYLATIMDQELNTLIEDDSDIAVGKCLCHLYQLCEAGKDAQVMEELSKMPKYDLSACRIQENLSEENEDDSPQLVAAHMSGLHLSEKDNPTSNSIKIQPSSALTEQEKLQHQDEEDGWTVVRKGNKKH